MLVYRRVFRNASLNEKDALKPGSLNVYAKNAMGNSSQTRWNKVWYSSINPYMPIPVIYLYIYIYIYVWYIYIYLLHEWLIFKESVG